MGRRRHGNGGRRGPVRSQRLPGLTGTVRMHARGGEVETAEGTYRLGERGLREAMDGDRVYVSLHRGPRGRRVAAVEHVIERAMTGIVGTFEPAGPLGAVRPLDARIRQDFFVLPEDGSPARLGAAPGDIVVARILEYPARSSAGVVTLERRLGDEDAPELGIECVMARYGLSDGYPAGALEEAARLSLDVDAALADPLRRDIRDRFLITIDPVDARDFDDAISVEQAAAGGWRLGVHIADVSHYVAWDGAVDLEARRRGTSVYLADRVLPMLPEALCDDLCSLRPDEDRLAVTVDMELDARGRVRGYEAYPSVVRSRVRTDYGAVDLLLSGESSRGGACEGEEAGADARGHPEPATEDGAADASAPVAPGMRPVSERARAACSAAARCGVDLAAFLRDAAALADVRRAIRRRRGAIDFDTVEVHALLDADGHPADIVARERSEATGLVEEAMLLANECVAEYLSDRGLATAYRAHEAPSPDALAAAVKVLTEIGVLDPGRAMDVVAGNPHAIATVVEAACGTPTAPIVNALLLRAQQRALYKPRNEGHYALGARAYCHFTSPIRRYPDLLVHRVLKLELARRRLGAKEAAARAVHLTGKGPHRLDAILPQLCRAASAAERAADAAARATQKVKVAQYYAARIGERCAGTVSWISELGAFVRLDGTGAEGLVRMAALGGGEWWDLDEVRLRLTGSSTGAVIELGQRVVVEVAATDVVRGRLDLAMVRAG